MKSSFIFLMSCLISSASARGVEFLWISPSFDDKGGFALEASLFSGMGEYGGVLENGIYAKFPNSDAPPSSARSGFGYHIGYTFIPRFPLLRPGLNAGVATLNWVDEGGSRSWRILPTYGAKLQVSILTLSVSSLGFGLGLNLPLP
jgi:hypothetical protein